MKVFLKPKFSLGAFQICVYVPYRFAHQLCLPPLVKIEFKPHYKNRFLIKLFSFYTGISIVVLKAACRITVHKMFWYCSRTIHSDLYIISFLSCTVIWKAGCRSLRLEEKVYHTYILNYFRISACDVSLTCVIYLYVLLFKVYALLRSRIYIIYV